MTTTNELSLGTEWIMRGVYIFSLIFAFVADVALVDQTKEIRRQLRTLERWIKKLPIRAVIRWHIKYLSEKLEASLWKKHPDWMCFITGYLITAILCAHSIIVYLPEVRKIPSIPAESLPTSALLSPVAADVLGGLILVLIRHLLYWGKRANLVYLYMVIIVCKASVALIIFLSLFLGLFRGIFEYMLTHSSKTVDTPLLTYYWRTEALMGLMFYLACFANAIWLMDWILYCFEFSLSLWVLSLLAIWITKAIRLLLKKADGMYCTGAVGSCSAFTELMLQAYPYITSIPQTLWFWLRFYFGLGH